MVTIEVQLEADDRDASRAEGAMRKLRAPDAMQALKEAIAAVVQEHITGSPTVKVTDQAVTAHIGYINSQLV